MSRPLPDLIDPLRLVNKQRTLQGSLAVDRLGQLKSVLCSSDGEIKVDLIFARDQNGQANIKGNISTTLWMICQRCLQPMSWQKQISVCLALVNTELEVSKLLPHYEPLFLHEDMLSVAEIVEAEIILALPQIVLHPSAHCAIDKRYVTSTKIVSADVGETEADNLEIVNVNRKQDKANEKRNPFAVLQRIKKKD